MRRLMFLACLLFLLLSSCTPGVQESAQLSEPVQESSTAQAETKITAQSSTWLVVRHAEKDKDGQLSDAGKLRAKELKKLAVLFRIKAVYATDFPRTQDTGKPTAAEIGVEVTTYPAEVDPAWFSQLKTKHAGETILIVGHSNTVDPIVGGLGGKGDFTVGHDDYDDLFIVTTSGNTANALRMKYGTASEE